MSQPSSPAERKLPEIPSATGPDDSREGGGGSKSMLLLLPDGRLLIRNATPALITLLSGILPDHPDLPHRAALSSRLPNG